MALHKIFEESLLQLCFKHNSLLNKSPPELLELEDFPSRTQLALAELLFLVLFCGSFGKFGQGNGLQFSLLLTAAFSILWYKSRNGGGPGGCRLLSVTPGSHFKSCIQR